jgi:hypothetical protein
LYERLAGEIYSNMNELLLTSTRKIFGYYRLSNWVTVGIPVIFGVLFMPFMAWFSSSKMSKVIWRAYRMLSMIPLRIIGGNPVIKGLFLEIVVAKGVKKKVDEVEEEE